MSTAKQESDLKRYCKEIKLLFSTFGEHEKEFLANLKADAEDYADSDPEGGYPEFVARFGKPNAIISEYFAKADYRYLSKRIRTARYIKICAAVVIAIVVIVAGIRVGFYYKGYLDAKEAYLHVEKTQIEKF
jgi:hypothetical protein